MHGLERKDLDRGKRHLDDGKTLERYRISTIKDTEVIFLSTFFIHDN